MRPAVSSSFFRPALFFPDVEAGSKKELFGVLVDALWSQGIAQHRRALLERLLERERLGTTGFGSGVAIPHARSPMIQSSAVAFARLVRPLDFAAPDGMPVQLVFLVATPYAMAGELHLPLLAAIAGAVQDERVRTQLLEVQEFEKFHAMMHRFVNRYLMEASA